MNERITEERERNLAERFERGEPLDADELEKSVELAYRQNCERLRSFQAPSVDKRALAAALKKEMQMDRGPERRTFNWFGDVLKPAFAPALVLFFIVGWIGKGVAQNPIERVTVERNGESRTSWMWKQKFLWGRAALSPEGVRLRLTMKDRSTVVCSPHTRIAFDYNDARRGIRMDAGKVEIEASKNALRPMIVDTPVGCVRVTGTKFTIEIKP